MECNDIISSFLGHFEFCKFYCVKHSNIIYEKSRFFHAWSTWSNVQEMCIKDFIFVQGIFREKPLRFFCVSTNPLYFHILQNAQQILFDNIRKEKQSHGHCISIINMVLRYHGIEFTEFLLINAYQWYVNEGSLKSAFAHTAAIYLEVFCHKFSMFLH